MNKTFVYGIATVIAVATMSTYAETNEVAALRSELASVSARLAELEKAPAAAPAEKSSWADKIRIKGDLRYRYEYRDSDDPGISNKSRQRIRARIGAYGEVNEKVDFGVRLATGSNDSPTSTNQDIDNYASSKDIWLDLAYMTIRPVKDMDVTLGKMKQPWEQVSDLVFDGDVNPEGVSAGYKVPLENVSIMLHAGHFILDENTGDDVQMTSGQIAGKVKVADGVSVKAGATTYLWNNPDLAVVGKGNTGAVDFNIVEGFAQVDLKETPLPIKIYGDYLQNLGTSISEDTAWLVGIGTKLGDASLSYNYREIEPDAIYGNLADSDFHDGGTGGKGHKLSAKYELMKHLTAGVTYFITETEAGNDVNTLQLDLVAKF